VNDRAVIFDLDGVLVDSEPYWREGFREASRVIARRLDTAAPELSDEELRSYEGGRVPDTVRTLAEQLFGLSGDREEQLVEEAVRAAVHRASALFEVDPQPHEATVRAAVELHQRGFRLAVASSSAPEFIDAVLERLELADRVEVVESAFPLRHAKPHPEVYLNAIARLGVPVERCLAVEDSWTGVQSALRAGLRTIWVTDQAVPELEEQVERLWNGDPALGALARPAMMYATDIDAGVVERFFSEAWG
jgi:HAD superfamily hydrolase (TIGR01509 family)